MKQQKKSRGFTFYFQETPEDERWINLWAEILYRGDLAGGYQWRHEHEQKVADVFFEICKSGISIDTIEEPRVALFIHDKVEIEVLGKNGKVRRCTVRSWGYGGKTPAQLKRKLVEMIKEVLRLVVDLADFGPEGDLKREDLLGLLGFIENEDARWFETFEFYPGTGVRSSVPGDE